MDDRRVLARAALIPSGEPHALETGGERIFYALVEPDGPAGAARARLAQELRGLDLAGLISLGAEPAGDRVSLVCRSMLGVSPSALLQMRPVVASWPV